MRIAIQRNPTHLRPRGFAHPSLRLLVNPPTRIARESMQARARDLENCEIRKKRKYEKKNRGECAKCRNLYFFYVSVGQQPALQLYTTSPVPGCPFVNWLENRRILL